MKKATGNSTQKVIVFQLDDNEYALSVDQVIAIEKLHHITRIPGLPSFIKGVINLRGIIIPIIDLKKRFAIGDSEYTESTRIIIVSFNEIEAGLVVDSANDVIDIPKDAIEPQPDVIGAIGEDFISGVAKLEKRLLILLNIEEIVAPVNNE